MGPSTPKPQRGQPAKCSDICSDHDKLSGSADDAPRKTEQRWYSGALSTQHDKEIWSVALPALASMLLEPIMGVINSALVARLGTQQLGAVSVASLAISFCTFLFSFLLFLTTPEIAAAVVKGDRGEVSRISAKGFWVAGVFGSLATACMWLGGPAIIALMKPPEAEVARYASEYISVRAFGVLAALLGFVATGTYRGWKDTRTPLYAAVGSAATSLVLNVVFIYGLGMGVYGSGLATTLAQYVSCGALCVLLVRKDMLRLADLARPPPLASVWPLLRKGLVLAVRNIISFGMILYASALCVRAGSAYQASFEIVRQVWILTIQFFECLNVAAQTLCAAYLGAGDARSAGAVLARLLALGVAVGGGVGVCVAASQCQLVAFFTSDAAVVAQVLATLPMVAALFPLDAAASIMDGSLLAAKQTDYLSYVQIVGSVLQYFGLIWLASNHMINNLTIWSTLKLLTVFRFVGGYYRNYFSPLSAYVEKQPAATTCPATSKPASARTSTSTPAASPGTDSTEEASPSAPVLDPVLATSEASSSVLAGAGVEGAKASASGSSQGASDGSSQAGHGEAGHAGQHVSGHAGNGSGHHGGEASGSGEDQDRDRAARLRAAAASAS
eukprot:CAMPEP_0202858174 /NCGR_PEP_ID=MMETSP1391-20130828/817_1 /ASSEMBLY_ACC=CAM_ASM_000867 /TAXON_ID=1034604 /ORGANISM="Chlamydomonas leiostraca, Strain SAG 11-49" /LENGTH=615 /DNA_ID=CAMNT_0049537061 /DNA_START=313 /DNA_END=2161 /DNA_ORIENTATION=+